MPSSVLNVPSPAWRAEEEFTLFADSVDKFLDEHAPAEKQDQWRKDRVVERDLWTKAGKAGLLGLEMPAAYGGAGGDFRHEAIFIEETALRGVDGWGVSVHAGIVMPYIETYGSEEQKMRWLPRLASGELVGAIAMTEPGTGPTFSRSKPRPARQVTIMRSMARRLSSPTGRPPI